MNDIPWKFEIGQTVFQNTSPRSRYRYEALIILERLWVEERDENGKATFSRSYRCRTAPLCGLGTFLEYELVATAAPTPENGKESK